MIDISKLTRRDEKKIRKIKYETLITCGVKDTDFNRRLYAQGDNKVCLDLIAEAVANEVTSVSEDTKREQLESINKEFLDEQDRLHCKWCDKSYLTLKSLNKHQQSKHKKEL